jgi:hypothetical protein
MPDSTIKLRVSGDHFNGNPEFQVVIDNHLIGANNGVQAVHDQHQWQDITLPTGDLDPSIAHDVVVRFVNDASDGGRGTAEGHDRNLFVDSLEFGGRVYQGESANNTAALGYEGLDSNAGVMLANGSLTFHINAGASSSAETPAPQSNPESAPTTAPATTTPAHDSTANFFAADSLWNTPIGDHPALSAQSGHIAQLLDASGFGFQRNLGDWGVNVAVASADTPRHTITDGNPNGWRMDGVPLTPDSVGTHDSDSHLVILDPSQNKVWNFLGAGDLYHTHKAVAFGVFDMDGSGWWDPSAGTGGPWTGRSSNASYLAGLITADELEAGHIDHALAVGIDVSLMADVPAAPARTTDGTIPGGIPNGTHLQLDPSLDLNSLNLGREAMIVAEALQEYGAFVTERTSGFAVYFQSNQNLPTDPYAGADFTGLDQRLHEHWQVLQPEAPASYDSVVNHWEVHL